MGTHTLASIMKLVTSLLIGTLTLGQISMIRGIYLSDYFTQLSNWEEKKPGENRNQVFSGNWMVQPTGAETFRYITPPHYENYYAVELPESEWDWDMDRRQQRNDYNWLDSSRSYEMWIPGMKK